MLTVKSKVWDYSVEEFPSLEAALQTAVGNPRNCYLVDQKFSELHAAALRSLIPEARVVYVEATEENKSYTAVAPVIQQLLQRGLKRDGTIVVLGGGVLQDIGCFIASVLFRGLRWELVPTTLLAQADSCIGSKSSINIGEYKNQLGTFYPPNRVLMTSSVLGTLPWDEIRSGLGEVIKLQLLAGERGFRELMVDLSRLQSEPALLGKWVRRSLEVKKPYIETDEFDRGVRNLLNYGHTFGHAYESATHYAIPHGIAVILGMLTATYLSARLGLVAAEHYQELKSLLGRWHEPYGNQLSPALLPAIFQAIRHDKKATGDAINCILTRGFGRMEKSPVPFETQLVPAVTAFVQQELAVHNSNPLPTS